MKETAKEKLISLLNNLPADDIIWDKDNKEKVGAAFMDDYSPFKIKISIVRPDEENDT